MAYKNPYPTVDAIIYSIELKKILFIKRKNPPFEGQFALPGGFVDYGESVEHACVREVKEETSLDITKIYLFGVYSDPERDPRFHTMSTVFLAPVKGFEKAKAADDAADLEIIDFEKAISLKLAFDHSKIIKDFFSFLDNPGLFLKDRMPYHVDIP